MEKLKIAELRKKNRHFNLRVSAEEREALEEYCQQQQISFTDFFRIAIRKVINQKTTR